MVMFSLPGFSDVHGSCAFAVEIPRINIKAVRETDVRSKFMDLDRNMKWEIDLNVSNCLNICRNSS